MGKIRSEEALVAERKERAQEVWKRADLVMQKLRIDLAVREDRMPSLKDLDDLLHIVASLQEVGALSQGQPRTDKKPSEPGRDSMALAIDGLKQALQQLINTQWDTLPQTQKAALISEISYYYKTIRIDPMEEIRAGLDISLYKPERDYRPTPS